MAELNRNQQQKMSSTSLGQKTNQSVFIESVMEQEEMKVMEANIRELTFTLNFGIAKKFMEHLNKMKDIKLTDKQKYDKYFLRNGVFVC